MENWMQTYSGIKFDLADPAVYMVDPYDIAHALSRLPRFGGHTNHPYTVAQHSWECVDVAKRQMQSQEFLKCLFLHDASEAYCVDIPRPLKSLLPGYAAIEKKIQNIILERFGLSWEIYEKHHDAIKEIDNRMLYTEKSQLFMKEMPWSLDGIILPYPDVKIKPYADATSIKTKFLNEYLCLFGWNR